MTSKTRTRLAVAAAVLCVALILFVPWYRARRLTPAELLERMPTADALVLSIDFAALRRAGVMSLLDGPRVAEDPEYQGFVRKTNFNYKQDLDLAIAAFGPSGKYMLLKGRFDWKSLQAYAAAQGGGCRNGFCKMAGSTPDRKISFFPLRSGVMALAVSPDDGAALRMQVAATSPPGVDAAPDAPVWLRIPPAALKSGANLPDGTLPFAHTVDTADSIVLAFQPDGKGIAAKLEVVCRTEQDAAGMAAQLTKITNLLRRMIEVEHQRPNPADFSGVLTAGSFRATGRRVLGYWPIDRAFVETLAGAH